jgi:hypothetical protein
MCQFIGEDTSGCSQRSGRTTRQAQVTKLQIVYIQVGLCFGNHNPELCSLYRYYYLLVNPKHTIDTTKDNHLVDKLSRDKLDL